jgi:predicted ArsR family transcriptional regulator
MLVRLAAQAGVGAEEAAEVGREAGAADGVAATPGESCLAALVDELSVLGFDPAVAGDEDDAVVAFTHCPFRDLAQAHPELVCNLHRGIVEGFVAQVGGGTAEVTDFHTLVHREPCQVALTRR